MASIGSRAFAAIMALLAVAALAACVSTGTPQDDRYQTRGGGWDNFRA
jgi:hypothetical protein